MPGGDVGDHLWDEEGVVFGAFILIEGIVAGFLLKGVEAADACGEDYAYAVAVKVGVVLELRVVYRLSGGVERVLGVEVHRAHLFAVEMLCGVETLDFASELGFEL